MDPYHFIQLYDASEGPRSWFGRTRFAATLLGAFSVVAFVLAVTGVFAVVTFEIRRRTREIGTRKAIGARDEDAKRWILARSVRATAIGVGAGLVEAAAIPRVLGGLVYEVEPLDIATTLAAAVILGAASLVASYLPARRLDRISPLKILRSE